MQRSSTKTRPYKIIAPDGTELSGKWFRSEETFKRDLATGEVRFLKKTDGWSVQFKQRLAAGKKLRTILDEEDFTDNRYRSLSEELTKIIGVSFGHPPKPLVLMKTLINSVCQNDENSIVMDFFSGSATTAHAVMELNASDGGQRKFIMIQLPEETPDNSEAYRAGYKNICEIGRERIRRAGDKLLETHPELDAGFRVLKVDESNFVPLPEKIIQQTLPEFVDNIKPDRNELDLLFGALLEMGLPIDLPVTSEELDGFKILRYGKEIFACFDKDISPKIFQELARREPKKIIFRDAAFKNSSDKINALEIIKAFAHGREVVKII